MATDSADASALGGGAVGSTVVVVPGVEGWLASRADFVLLAMIEDGVGVDSCMIVPS